MRIENPADPRNLPRAQGHVFDERLRCYGCGRAIEAHWREPAPCPSPPTWARSRGMMVETPPLEPTHPRVASGGGVASRGRFPCACPPCCVTVDAPLTYCGTCVFAGCPRYRGACEWDDDEPTIQ